jgi:hypothetical protein
LTTNPKEAWLVANALQQSLAEGEHGLTVVPKLVVKIVDEELWRAIYCGPTKTLVEFKSFAEFVTTSLPEGLGCTIKMIQNICRDSPAALDAIDRATANPVGRPETLDNIQDLRPAPTGTSKDAALRRLRKDRPDLHAKVLAEELSANAAMVAAGFRKKPTPDEAAVKAIGKAENRLVVAKALIDQAAPHELVAMQEWIQERL